MPDLTQRSPETELLDRDDIPFDEIRLNMQELNTINTVLGGHAITLAGVRNLSGASKRKNLHICEIGCGGGDNLKAISKRIQGAGITFTGIDIKPACIQFAREQYPELNAQWIISDYRTVVWPGGKPDIIFSSLFCHHFRSEELSIMLQWMKSNSRLGFFINDLHRHPLAYYSIHWLTRLFSRSRLVKYDAPLSVARGFSRRDWTSIIQSSGIGHVTIHWKWAFRHLLIYRHEPDTHI